MFKKRRTEGRKDGRNEVRKEGMEGRKGKERKGRKGRKERMDGSSNVYTVERWSVRIDLKSKLIRHKLRIWIRIGRLV